MPPVIPGRHPAMALSRAALDSSLRVAPFRIAQAGCCRQHWAVKMAYSPANEGGLASRRVIERLRLSCFNSPFPSGEGEAAHLGRTGIGHPHMTCLSQGVSVSSRPAPLELPKTVWREFLGSGRSHLKESVCAGPGLAAALPSRLAHSRHDGVSER